MPVIVRRDGSDIIVPAGIPEFVIDGIGMIILQGPRYATSYLYRREFGIDTKAERKVAVVKITWPYIAAPNSIDMMNSALVAAGINPDDMLRQIRMMH